MLSSDQLKNTSLYIYRAGMVNVVYVAGILRHPRKNEGFIQQTNNLNQMIHFRCEPGVVIPKDFTEGQPIKIIARMQCEYVNGKPAIQLEVKKFELPSIQDMPPRKAWEQATRAGVPTDDVMPNAYREEKLDGWRVEDTGNMAQLAGFVAAYSWEAPKEAGGGCLTMYIRQTKDEKDLLAVRCYGGQSKSLSQKLSVGMPLYFSGRISVDIKNTGEPADEKGILPTHKFQYLRVRTLNVPGARQITMQPDWVPGMVQASQSERQARAKAQAERAAVAKAAPVLVQAKVEQQLKAAQTPISSQEQAGALARQNIPAPAAEIPADILAMLAKQ